MDNIIDKWAMEFRKKENAATITALEKFSYKGYECIVRNGDCFDIKLGYVVIPENHKYFEKPFNEIEIDCHYGLTFSGYLRYEDKLVYAIGFDCGHGMDLDFVKPEPKDPSEWMKCNKDVAFVKNELKSIVNQLCTE
jgi:hypothetical protein